MSNVRQKRLPIYIRLSLHEELHKLADRRGCTVVRLLEDLVALEMVHMTAADRRNFGENVQALSERIAT